MEDAKIIDLYWARDDGAIAETDRKYGKYCYSIAFCILNDSEDSHECVNDTWLAAWNAMPPNRPQMLSTFLGKITRNLSLKKWRGRTAQKRGGMEFTLALDELEETIPGRQKIDEHLDESELVKAINDFLSGLTEEERRIFICRYWYFDRIADIAERFGFGESNVKMKLKRVRDRLREHLKGEGIFI